MAKKREGKYVKGANPVPPQLKKHLFPPGQSGNPAGGKRRMKFSEIIERLADVVCDEPDIENPNKLTYAELLVRGMFKAGIKGDASMTGMLFDRVEGKVTEKHIVADLTGMLPELDGLSEAELEALDGELERQLEHADRELLLTEQSAAAGGADRVEERAASPEGTQP